VKKRGKGDHLYSTAGKGFLLKLYNKGRENIKREGNLGGQGKRGDSLSGDVCRRIEGENRLLEPIDQQNY